MSDENQHILQLAMAVDAVAEDGYVTAILIAPGELKNKGLYLPDDVAPVAAQMFVGKPVFLDHGISPNPDTRPDNRRISEIASVWTEGGAVYGKFAVANESIRGILRGLKDMGLGGMSAVIQYLSVNGVISAIVGVASVDVVLTPASEGARILQASQTQPDDVDLSWFNKARQFFAMLAQPIRQSPEPAQAEPATSDPTEEIIMDDALTAALDAMQAAIMDANKTAVAALDTKIEAQTEALALTNAAVSAMVKKQVDDQMAGFRKKMMKDKMSADLPDMPVESLDSLVDALYAQRVDDETEEAMMSRMDTLVGPFKAFAEAQKAALAARYAGTGTRACGRTRARACHRSPDSHSVADRADGPVGGGCERDGAGCRRCAGKLYQAVRQAGRERRTRPRGGCQQRQRLRCLTRPVNPR